MNNGQRAGPNIVRDPFGNTQQHADFSIPTGAQHYAPSFPSTDAIPAVYRHVANLGFEASKSAYMKSGIQSYFSFDMFKYYFDVNNSYVVRKIKLILAPYLEISEWKRMQNEYDQSQSMMPASQDIQAPDLYIPMISLITYVLIVGFILGTDNRFDPEILGIKTTKCVVLWLLEVGIIKIGFFMLHITNAPFFEVLSYSGYKFIGLVLNEVIAVMFGQLFYYVSLLYTGGMIAIFMIKTLRRFTHHNTMAEHIGTVSSKRQTFLYVCGGMQILMLWILGLY